MKKCCHFIATFFSFSFISEFHDILHRLINIGLFKSNIYAFECIVEINQAAFKIIHSERVKMDLQKIFVFLLNF